MGVHAAAIIVLDRLGHERCRFAIGLRHHVDDIFVDLHAVCGLRQRAECQPEFMLCRGNLMVVLVARQPHFEHRRDHFPADILCAVDRRDGKIAALGARAMPQIAAFVRSPGVGRQFDIVDFESRLVIAGFELHIVEHEKLGFRADIDGVANAGRFEIRLGALGG